MIVFIKDWSLQGASLMAQRQKPACNAGDRADTGAGVIPGWERCPKEGNG